MMDIFTLNEEFNNLSKERKKETLCNLMNECIDRNLDEYIINILNIAEDLANEDYFGTEALDGYL